MLRKIKRSVKCAKTFARTTFYVFLFLSSMLNWAKSFPKALFDWGAQTFAFDCKYWRSLVLGSVDKIQYCICFPNIFALMHWSSLFLTAASVIMKQHLTSTDMMSLVLIGLQTSEGCLFFLVFFYFEQILICAFKTI